MGRSCVAFAALGLSLAAPAQAFEASKGEVDAFVQADRNQDGQLTKPEFKVFIQAMAATGQPTAKQVRMFGAYGYAFNVADVNKDGIVTPQELRAGDNRHRAGN